MAKTYKVEGYKTVSYFSKKRNEQVEGTSLYVSRDISAEEGATGRECKEVWLTQQATYKPLVGDEVCILYNDRGYVDDVISYGSF